MNPKWLRDLSHVGAKIESQLSKDAGDRFLREGKYRLANINYQRALEIKPDNIGARVNQAIAYARSGFPDHAVSVLQQALQIETPQKGAIYFNLAKLYEKQKNWDKAVQHYKRALKFKVNRRFVYQKLGTVYLSMKRYDDAREAFERSLEHQINPTVSYREMLQNAAFTFEEEKYLKVIEKQLAQEVQIEDLSPYDMEIVYQTIQSDPVLAGLYSLLGFACANLNDYDAAIDYFQKTLEIEPANEEAKKNIKALREFKEDQPTHPDFE